MKRLTLKEYREQNAIALGNENVFNGNINDAENYVIRRYLDYLLYYGIDKYSYENLFNKVMRQPVNKPLTSEQIEVILSERNHNLIEPQTV